MGRAPEVAPVVEVLAAAVVLQEATALDKAAPGWRRECKRRYRLTVRSVRF
jgi:hypothetical protein